MKNKTNHWNGFFFYVSILAKISFGPQKIGVLQWYGQTDKQTNTKIDIADIKLNWPQGQFGEKLNFFLSLWSSCQISAHCQNFRLFNIFLVFFAQPAYCRAKLHYTGGLHCISLHLHVRCDMLTGVRPSVRPSVHPSVRPSVRPSVCPSVRPSVHPCMEDLILLVSTGYVVVTGNPQHFQSRVHFCEVNINNFW